MRRIDVLNFACSILQLLALVLIVGKLIPNWGLNEFAGVWVLIAIGGFSAVVKYFSWSPDFPAGRLLRDLAAIAGAILVAIACFAV